MVSIYFIPNIYITVLMYGLVAILYDVKSAYYVTDWKIKAIV